MSTGSHVRQREHFAALITPNLCFGVMMFGRIPASFGLGFWEAITSVVVGTIVGALVVAPLAVISLRTGAGLEESAATCFGPRGRSIGVVVGLLLAVGYAALSLWTAGTAVAVAAESFLGVAPTPAVRAWGLLCLCVLAGAAAREKSQFVVRAGNWLAALMLLYIVLGVVGYADQLQFASRGVPVTGDLWSSWVLSALVAGVSGPVALVTVVGDRARHLSPAGHSSAVTFVVAFAGLVAGVLVPLLFGVYVAFGSPVDGGFVAALVGTAPGWLLLPLLLNAVLGAWGNASMSLHGAEMSLRCWRSRMSGTCAAALVTACTAVLVLTSDLWWDSRTVVTFFVVLLTCLAVPWAAVMILCHLRGGFSPDAAHAYVRGWNMRAAASWCAGAAVGLLSCDNQVFQGPFSIWTGGVDISFVSAAVTTATVYLCWGRPVSDRPETDQQDAILGGHVPVSNSPAQ